MNALDAYKGLLKELDKWESPTFSIGDFNYFFPKSVQKYITENYKDIDPVQKDIDDIRTVLIFNEALAFSGGKADLPTEYQHILYLELTCKFLQNVGKYKVDDVKTFTEVRREKSAQRGTQNAYRKTSFLRPYYKMDIDSIYAILDTNVVELQSGKMDFIRKFTDVYLNPDKSSDYNNPANNTLIDFPDYVVREIIVVCRTMFLENIESQRFQSSIMENQVKSE